MADRVIQQVVDRSTHMQWIEVRLGERSVLPHRDVASGSMRGDLRASLPKPFPEWYADDLQLQRLHSGQQILHEPIQSIDLLQDVLQGVRVAPRAGRECVLR